MHRKNKWNMKHLRAFLAFIMAMVSATQVAFAVQEFKLAYVDAANVVQYVPMEYSTATQTYSVQVPMVRSKDFFIMDSENTFYGSSDFDKRALTQSNSTSVPLAANMFNMWLTESGTFTFILSVTSEGMSLTVEGWPEPYAVLDDGTLSFYFDALQDTRTGTKFPVEWWKMYTTPRWYSSAESVTTVTFDSSFANYTGLTNAENMFARMKNLTAINGMENFNTSRVTNMRQMFAYCHALSSIDFSHFSTASVTDMNYMFHECVALQSLDLSSFSTKNVKSMEGLFGSCQRLVSINLSSFNTSNVTAMYGMFQQCSRLTNVDLSSFNTANVTDMWCMFQNCYDLQSLDLRGFNMAKVADTRQMFQNCSSLQTIYCNDDWNQGVVEQSTDMFTGCTILVGSIAYDSEKTTVQYANPAGYFTDNDAYAVLNGNTLTYYYDLQMASRPGTKFYFGSVGSEGWTSDVRDRVTTVDFDPSFADYKPTDLSYMFKGLSNLTAINNIDRLNTEKVKYMTDMFMYCSKLTDLDLSHFNAPLLVNAQAMFWGCSKLTTLNLLNFTTTTNTNLDGMFFNCSKLQTIYCLHTWSCQEGTSSNMFYDCTSLVGAVSYSSGNTGIAFANPYTGYFTRPTEAYALLSTDKTTLTFYYDDMKSEREGTEGTAYIIPWEGSRPGWNSAGMHSITTATFDPSFGEYHGLTSTAYMFLELYFLEAVTNLQYLNTENVTNMQGMFQGSGHIKELDVSTFNTSKVENMHRMFYFCSELTTIYCDADWSQGIVGDSQFMFAGCPKLSGAADFDTDKDEIEMANPATGYFTYKNKPGDVNGDSQVTIADVTALVNIILGKDTAGQYNHEAADINHDNGITIADVTALVNIILGK